jgi:hypothetical protein
MTGGGAEIAPYPFLPADASAEPENLEAATVECLIELDRVAAAIERFGWRKALEVRWHLCRATSREAKRRGVDVHEAQEAVARERGIGWRTLYHDAQVWETFREEFEGGHADALPSKGYFQAALRAPDPRAAIGIMIEKHLAHGAAYSVAKAAADARAIRNGYGPGARLPRLESAGRENPPPDWAARVSALLAAAEPFAAVYADLAERLRGRFPPPLDEPLIGLLGGLTNAHALALVEAVEAMKGCIRYSRKEG